MILSFIFSRSHSQGLFDLLQVDEADVCTHLLPPDWPLGSLLHQQRVYSQQYQHGHRRHVPRGHWGPLQLRSRHSFGLNRFMTIVFWVCLPSLQVNITFPLCESRRCCYQPLNLLLGGPVCHHTIPSYHTVNATEDPAKPGDYRLTPAYSGKEWLEPKYSSPKLTQRQVGEWVEAWVVQTWLMARPSCYVWPSRIAIKLYLHFSLS